MTTCLTNEPLTVTQPHFVKAVTLSTINGRVNVHLDDDPELPEIVYRAETTDLDIHANIALIASLAYVNNMRVTITWEGGQDEPTTGGCLRFMKRITLEGDRGLIPWTHREQP